MPRLAPYALAWTAACAPAVPNTVVPSEDPGLVVRNATEGEVVCHVRVGAPARGVGMRDLLGPTEVLPPHATLVLPPEALPDEEAIDVRLDDCNGDRLLERLAVPRGPGLRVVFHGRPSQLRAPSAAVGATERDAEASTSGAGPAAP